MNPHGSPMQLRIDTTQGQFQDVALSSRTPSAGVLSFPLDSDIPNTARISPNSVPFPSRDEVPSNISTHRVHESRKLLAHLLRQLRRRPMPPTVFLELNNSTGDPRQQDFSALPSAAAGTGKNRAGKLDAKANNIGEEDDDDENKDVYTTDVTYDLMFQLKEVLVISVQMGWKIFHDSAFLDPPTHNRPVKKSTSPFRRSTNTLSAAKRSRSPSNRDAQLNAPELLSQCISTLASIVYEDCRYKISPPQPSRPPYALQALTLEVARFLTYTQRHDPQIIARIGNALIPAFDTFNAALHVRLLSFFEESVIRGALEDLGKARGGTETILSARQNASQGIVVKQDSPPVYIQIEEVHDESPAMFESLNWHPWTTGVPSEKHCLPSTNAPSQPLAVYHLASLIPPLLAGVLENLGLETARPELLYRMVRFIDAVVSIKVDAYLDVLEVIAYHTPKARHAAIVVLANFWPKALGHVVIGRPLPALNYTASYYESRQLGGVHNTHQFVPWRFGSSSHTSRLIDCVTRQECPRCLKDIHDFGLLCPLCMISIHFGCYDYPEGCQSFEYTTPSNSTTHGAATFRFCHILPTRTDFRSHTVRRGSHDFKLVNLFTLGLCFVCRKPLWGYTLQGYRCTWCKLFAHVGCISASSASLRQCGSFNFDSSFVEIDWSELRQSFVDYYHDFPLLNEDLDNKTYEDISVFFASLWIQSQILNNGVALGSIVVRRSKNLFWPAKEGGIPEFELQQLVKLYHNALSSDRLLISEFLTDYFQQNQIKVSEHNVMFDWLALAYITASIKSPYDVQKPTISPSSSLLDVNPPEMPKEVNNESQHPFETVPLSHMRDALGYEMHVHSDTAARLILSQLHQLGFMNRYDLGQVLFDGKEDYEQIFCTFPLPLGYDLSADVETLVSAVESCLQDLDLSVNEAGLLLLGYENSTLLDLCGALQDDNLGTVLHDFRVKKLALPGVHLRSDLLPWPFDRKPRPSPTSSGDYYALRRALRTRYAAQWLLAVHNMDIALFAKLLYELSFEISLDFSHSDTVPSGTDSSEHRMIKSFDDTLRLIIKLIQSSVVFRAFDDIFALWLSGVVQFCKVPMSSILRLFDIGMDLSGRLASLPEATLHKTSKDELYREVTIDPWRVVKDVASRSKEGMSQALRWLCLFARSGVDVSVPTFMEFSTLAVRFGVSLDDGLVFVTAALSTSWLRPAGRRPLQKLFSSLHHLLASQVIHCLQTGFQVSDALCFVRQSLSACLLIYGCKKNLLVEKNMVLAEDIDLLPSRKNVRSVIDSDPVIVDAELLAVIERYMDASVDDVSCVVANFFHILFEDSDPPLMQSYEVDNFIVRSAKMLCTCAWNFYGIQRHEISSIRITFLLRVIAVDPVPFQDLLRRWFQSDTNWVMRLLAVSRLFRIILDVTSPYFFLKRKQWRSNVIHVFHYYFMSMWADPREEIRLTVDAWSQSLLPAHLEAISRCWDEALTTAPIVDREKLVAFLIQLHPHFPSWRVVSFSSLVELLVESEHHRTDVNHDAAPTPPIVRGLPSAHHDQQAQQSGVNMIQLRASTVLLALHLIADGISVDISSLLKIKIELLRIIGFTDVAVVPRINKSTFYVTFSALTEIVDIALPCVHDLPVVLDAAYPFNLPPSAMGGPYAEDDVPASLLVGSALVDVSLTIFCALPTFDSLTVLTVKSLLESLVIIIYKHDFDSRPLKHLQPFLKKAVLRAIELVLTESSYELRQLALSVMQAFIKKWPNSLNNLVLMSVEYALKLLVSLKNQTQDNLVIQARSFVESTLNTFASSGILNAICKHELEHESFVVLKHVLDENAKLTKSNSSEALRDTLLKDTFPRIPENEAPSFQQALNNLNSFVEIIHHQSFDVNLMQLVGIFLASIARRTSDWAPDAFDPTSMFMMSSTILQFNKAQSRDLLRYLETVLKAMLGRFHINAKCLSQLLHVTSTLYRKTRVNTEPSAGYIQPNIIAQAIFDTLADGLRMKVRVLPANLLSILEAIAPSSNIGSARPAAILSDSLWELADDGLNFLQQYIWSDTESEKDCEVSIVIANVVLQAALRNPEVMLRYMIDQGGEKQRQNLGLRTWNIMLIAALSSATEEWGAMLFAHFQAFAVTYYNELRSFTRSGVGRPEYAAANNRINHSYASIKLWLLLSQKLASRHAVVGENEVGKFLDGLMIWNELWPHFERLVNVFEADAGAGNTSPLATLAWSSAADLFVFLRQSRTVIALDTSSHIATLERLRKLNRPESNNKLTRALRIMTEPQSDVVLELLVNQAKKDVVVAEKLQAVEVRQREAGRLVQDRLRRDTRTAN